jgi:hypothetical protein
MQTVRIGDWRGFDLWLEPRDGALALAAYPAGQSSGHGNGLCVRGVGFHAVRPIDSLGQMLDSETMERDARETERKATALIARLDAAQNELSHSWPLQDEATRLLDAYTQVCAADASKDLAELPDRVTFRFGLR